MVLRKAYRTITILSLTVCFNSFNAHAQKSQLNFLDPDTDSIIDIINAADQPTQFKLQLEYFGTDTTLKVVEINVKTLALSDSETFTLSNPAFDGNKYIFKQMVSFGVSPQLGNATRDNGIITSSQTDRVSLYWQHPKELTDTAYKNINVRMLITPIKQKHISLNQQKVSIFKQKKLRGTMIEVLFSNPLHLVEATIVSSSGKELSHCVGSHTQRLSLPVANAANGVYFLKLQSGNEKLVQKIILSY